jgi:hypothetical protein
VTNDKVVLRQLLVNDVKTEQPIYIISIPSDERAWGWSGFHATVYTSRTEKEKSSSLHAEREVPSGLLANAATIASFGPPPEPLQRVLYVSLERLAAKCFEYPTPPSWRESEVSAILDATGGGVNSCAGEGCMVDGAQWKRDMQLDLMLFRIDHLDLERHIPLPAQP